MNQKLLFISIFPLLLTIVTESKPIEKPKEIREIGLRTIMKVVMDRMADLDKFKPNEEPKKEPKEIPEERNCVMNSFKIVSIEKRIVYF